MTKYLNIVQIIISILLIAAVLLQQRGADSSAIMGGVGASYYSRRGFEKFLLYATIVLAALFVIAAIVNIAIS